MTSLFATSDIVGWVVVVAVIVAVIAWHVLKQERVQRDVAARAGRSPVLAAAGPVMLLAQPLRISHPDGVWNLTPRTTADVEASGNVSVTRGRNLGNKAAGTLLLGPVGLFTIGNAKETVHDHRELYLLLREPDIVIPFHPDLGFEVRTLGQAINANAPFA